MIEQVWAKKIIAIIELDLDDCADDNQPLPLVLGIRWNSYFGFYMQEIGRFFAMYAPYPLNPRHFHLTVEPSGVKVGSTLIAYHLYQRQGLPLNEPLRMKFHFRGAEQEPQIDLKKHYRNQLKSSTALRYGKFGAARLTRDMSVKNVEDMFESFRMGNLSLFVGSGDFESDDLGYRFLTEKSEKVAIRFMHGSHYIERAALASTSLHEFVNQSFDLPEGQTKLQVKLHCVSLTDSSVPIGELEPLCDPDGYLYLSI